MRELIKFKIIPERETWNFLNENRDKIIGDYLKRLKTTKERLKDISWDLSRLLNIKIDDVERDSNIDNEIKLCEFYFEFKKKSKEQDFNKWIELNKEQLKKLVSHHYYTSDYYTKEDTKFFYRYNGRIKILIAIEKNEKTTKVSLNLDNDSSFIEFVEDKYKHFDEITYSNLKSEESIKAKIEGYKALAEKEYFSKIIYPNYSQELRQHDFLKILLHNEEK